MKTSIGGSYVVHCLVNFCCSLCSVGEAYKVHGCHCNIISSEDSELFPMILGHCSSRLLFSAVVLPKHIGVFVALLHASTIAHT